MPKYNDNILNYYNDDSHIGSLDINDKQVGTGLVGSPSCGDVMKLQIKIEKNKNNEEIIKDAKILVFGCGSAKASSSYVAEQLVGKTLEEAMKIKNTDIAEYLGLPKIKLHCSVLAESAIKRAVEDYKNKQSNQNSKNIGDKIKQIKTNCNIKNFSLSITDEAILFVKSNLEKVSKEKNKNEIKGIRLNIEEGHCGLMYKVRYVDNKDDIKNDIDYIAETKKHDYKLHIFIKKTEQEILNNTEIEYKEEGLKRGLIFKNPKETGRCNCGLNFFTKEKQKKNNSCK